MAGDAADGPAEGADPDRTGDSAPAREGGAQEEQNAGPILWRNHTAWAQGQPARRSSHAEEDVQARPLWEEFGLYSDVGFYGALELGPVELMFTLAQPPRDGGAAMVLSLRSTDHLLAAPPDARDHTEEDVSEYAGGGLDEQMAALLTLASGRRVRSGGETRARYDGDGEAGRPHLMLHRAPALFVEPLRRSRWVQSSTEMDMDAFRPVLEAYMSLAGRQAIAVQRAANQYADALWMIDAEPRTSWLRLFGALEAAADAHEAGQGFDEVQELERLHRGLYGKLRKRAPEAIPIVAKSLSRVIGAEAKMRSFVATFCPPPPAERPDGSRVDWDDLELALGVLYGHRSRELHGGVPFPDPLCEPPLSPGDGPPCERPPFLAANSDGGHWPMASLPMYLHVFAHIVGGALRAWLEQLATTPGASGPVPSATETSAGADAT